MPKRKDRRRRKVHPETLVPRQPPQWRWSDLWTDPPGQQVSLHRFWASIAMGALVPAFCWQAYRTNLGWSDWTGFAIACGALMSPAMASKLMSLRLGPGGQAPKKDGA